MSLSASASLVSAFNRLAKGSDRLNNTARISRDYSYSFSGDDSLNHEFSMDVNPNVGSNELNDKLESHGFCNNVATVRTLRSLTCFNEKKMNYDRDRKRLYLANKLSLNEASTSTIKTQPSLKFIAPPVIGERPQPIGAEHPEKDFAEASSDMDDRIFNEHSISKRSLSVSVIPDEVSIRSNEFNLDRTIPCDYNPPKPPPRSRKTVISSKMKKKMNVDEFDEKKTSVENEDKLTLAVPKSQSSLPCNVDNHDSSKPIKPIRTKNVKPEPPKRKLKLAKPTPLLCTNDQTEARRNFSVGLCTPDDSQTNLDISVNKKNCISGAIEKNPSQLKCIHLEDMSKSEPNLSSSNSKIEYSSNNNTIKSASCNSSNEKLYPSVKVKPDLTNKSSLNLVDEIRQKLSGRIIVDDSFSKKHDKGITSTESKSGLDINKNTCKLSRGSRIFQKRNDIKVMKHNTLDENSDESLVFELNNNTYDKIKCYDQNESIKLNKSASLNSDIVNVVEKSDSSSINAKDNVKSCSDFETNKNKSIKQPKNVIDSNKTCERNTNSPELSMRSCNSPELNGKQLFSIRSTGRHSFSPVQSRKMSISPTLSEKFNCCSDNSFIDEIPKDRLGQVHLLTKKWESSNLKINDKLIKQMVSKPSLSRSSSRSPDISIRFKDDVGRHKNDIFKMDVIKSELAKIPAKDINERKNSIADLYLKRINEHNNVGYFTKSKNKFLDQNHNEIKVWNKNNIQTIYKIK